MLSINSKPILSGSGILKLSLPLMFVFLFLGTNPEGLFAQTGAGATAYKDGRALDKKKDYDGALKKFVEAISLEPGNYRYFFYKGTEEFKLKKYDDAEQSFTQSAKLDPQHAGQADIGLAKIYLKQKNYPSAIRVINDAADKDPSKKLTYKLVVISLLNRSNRTQEAMQEVSKLKTENPNEPRVMNAEGDVYSAMNNYSAALVSYQKAVDEAKTSGMTPAQTAKFYYGLGSAYYKTGKTDKAAEAWKNVEGTKYASKVKAFTTQNSSRYYVAIATGYYKANVLDEATNFANKAIQVEQTSPNGYKMLGTVQIRKGQNQLAVNSLGKAADLEKDSIKRSKIYSSMIRLQFNSNDYAGASATADKILAKSPNNATVLGLKAQAEYQLGHYPNAIAVSDKAITASGTTSKDPTRLAPFYFTQGLAAKKAGDNEKAKIAFGNAAKGLYTSAARNEINLLAGK